MKNVVERALVASGVAALARRSTRAGTLILAYHDIVPEGGEVRGDASLHLPQRRFARQLDILGQLGDVVPLTAIDRAVPGSRPRFAVTFDDAYLGALTAGGEELRRRGMPATVFVAPALLGLSPWWDLIANSTTGTIESGARDHALSVLAGRRDAVLRWSGFTTELDCGDLSPVIASRHQLHESLASGRWTVGSHSWSHANLTAIERADLDRELAASAAWLRAEFPEQFIPWLAYPYGLVNDAVARSAEAAGYTAALRVEGGWLGRWNAENPFALPRLNVPRGVSDAGFTLRVSGLGGR